MVCNRYGRAEEKLFQAEKVFGGYALLVSWRYVRAEQKIISGGKVVWQIGFLRTLGVRARGTKNYIRRRRCSADFFNARQGYVRAEEEIFQAEKVFGGYAFLVPWRYALAEEKLFQAEKVFGGYAFLARWRHVRAEEEII